MTIRCKPIGLILILLTLSYAMPSALAARKPAPTKTDGVVVSSDSAGLTVYLPQEKHLSKLAVATNAKTEVQVDGKPASLSDLKPGQVVVITPPTGTAKKIESKSPRKTRTAETGTMEGLVIAASGNELTFLTPMSNEEIGQAKVVATDKTTVVIGDNKSAKLADLKPGQSVLMVFVSNVVRKVVAQE